MKIENFNMENEAMEAKKFELIPAGTYKVVVESEELKVASSGRDYIRFTLNVVDSERKILYDLYESTIRNKVIFAMARCFGLATVADTNDFVGKTGMIKYTHTTYEGEKKGEINPFRGFLQKEEGTVVDTPAAPKPAEEPDAPF